MRLYKTDQDYFADYARVKEEAITDIKSSDAFKRFNEGQINMSIPKEYADLPKVSIYKPSFIGKHFLMVDMKSANFTALKMFDYDIFGTDTWEDFMRKFTGNEHIIGSKYIRQVILGNCNPKRQISYEKYLTSKVIPQLEQMNPILSVGRIVEFSNDEIVYDLSDMSFAEMCDLKDSLQPIENFDYGVFKLEDLYGCGYRVLYTDGKQKLKGMESEYIPIIMALLNGDKLTGNDYAFPFKGSIARFDCEVGELPERMKNN